MPFANPKAFWLELETCPPCTALVPKASLLYGIYQNRSINIKNVQAAKNGARQRGRPPLFSTIRNFSANWLTVPGMPRNTRNVLRCLLRGARAGGCGTVAFGGARATEAVTKGLSARRQGTNAAFEPPLARQPSGATSHPRKRVSGESPEGAGAGDSALTRV